MVIVMIKPVFGQEKISYRLNAAKGTSPTHDFQYFGSKIDILAFDIGGKSPIYESGHLFQISASKNSLLLAGAYLSRWENADRWYGEPYLLAKAWRGKVTTTAKLFAYFPVNRGGKSFIGATEMSLTYKLTPTISAGIEGGFNSPIDSRWKINWGPTVKYSKGANNISFRYLGNDSTRLVISHNL